MDNVLEFPGKAAKAVVVNNGDPVNEFILDYLMPWAVNNGIDIESRKFKLNGATIMASLQGMLHDI